ncbi:Nucleotide-binding universal stress protein, UspA family [Burkholderiales bacterium 8X]|nr:Nucleotide-binding universal stress protein, UspA family [Burkholderiales bacterium 8X]
MATPRTILLHVDSSRRTIERTRVARQIAEAFDSQVSATHCAVSGILRYPYTIDAVSPETLAIFEDIDRRCHAKARAAFEEGAAGSPRLGWAELPGNDPFAFTLQALYADLLIVGQRDEDDPSVDELPASFLPSLLLSCGRPALVLPYIGAPAGIGRAVMIAWKETRESARAVAAALPWLRRAGRVDAVSHGPEAVGALARLAFYLQAHGVAASFHVGDSSESFQVGGQMLSTASDLEADLLVMGCYGHSRAREWILGGATRTILESMTLPVLMSH